MYVIPKYPVLINVFFSQERIGEEFPVFEIIPNVSIVDENNDGDVSLLQVPLEIMETVLEKRLVTYISLLTGLYAIPSGPFPTGIAFITESAQTLSKNKVLYNVSAIIEKRIKV